jgi:tRNA (adenine37-N6)-methyltransferase
MTGTKLNPIRPIGRVVFDSWNKGRTRFLARRNATIRVEPPYAPGLVGLEEYSHALVVYQLTRERFRPDEHLLYAPCLDRRWAPKGIFAQRCGHRPNQLGVTTVGVVKVAGREVVVRGLDAYRGTPVLDLKPFWTRFDRPDRRLRLPPWAKDA